MRCAVVNAQGVVINIIVANPEIDIAPEGCVLHEILSTVWIDIGMNWADRIAVVQQEPPPEEAA